MFNLVIFLYNNILYVYCISYCINEITNNISYNTLLLVRVFLQSQPCLYFTFVPSVW